MVKIWGGIHDPGCGCLDCDLARAEKKKKFKLTDIPGPKPIPMGYEEVPIPEEFEWWNEPVPSIAIDNTSGVRMTPTVTVKPAVNVDSELINDLLESVQKLKWEIVELRRELADDRKSRAQEANPGGFGEGFKETMGDEHEG